MSETKTVIGTLAGIMEKSGEWRQIHVAVPGKQYPVKMDTKREELIVLARAAGENVMEWTYTESDSGNPNPHRPGENFINRYFEGVAPVQAGASTAQAGEAAQSVASLVAAPQAGTDPKLSKDEWARKDSAAWKRMLIEAAADALKHTIPSDPTPEDLTTFLGRVTTLTLAWHRSVLAERDDPAGESVPF